MTQSPFFSPKFPCTWAGEGRSVCGRRDQQGRAVLGLITFLGFKEKLTLFLAVGFMESFPQEHRAVLTGTGVKQEG